MINKASSVAPLSPPLSLFTREVFRGRDDKVLECDVLNAGFAKVKWLKPVASRGESKEAFLLATGFTRPR
jgi:23S rRNA U2552 (ribose-2'-O)-methylase RlmE/FtsJ